MTINRSVIINSEERMTGNFLLAPEGVRKTLLFPQCFPVGLKLEILFSL